MKAIVESGDNSIEIEASDARDAAIKFLDKCNGEIGQVISVKFGKSRKLWIATIPLLQELDLLVEPKRGGR